MDVCPFDVLEVERFVAVVKRPADCCGVVACAEACPNGSLTIAEEGPQRGVPRVDEHLESADAPGVFLAGDLTGVPLIRNAIEQGARVTDHVARRPRSKRKDVVDLVIVGAGPAGLSAALRAKELGLTYVVLEQATVAASIQSFPRDKLVLDQSPAQPVGGLWLKETTKEELLLQWSVILRRQAITVREHERVTAVRRMGDRIEVTTDKGTCEGRHVLLATGRRGSPREVRFSMEAGAEGMVSYSLADARSFASKRVLVVGLGDSAMEASLALAAQPGTRVTISYRGSSFTRGKSRNIVAVQTAVAEGRLSIVWDSQLEAVGKAAATLRVKGAPESLPTDAVLLLVGGQAASELLRAAGVRLEGDEDLSSVPAVMG